MTTARIGPDHQITIPETVFEQLPLAVGDLLDVEACGGTIVLRPVAPEKAPGLTQNDQARLDAVRRKIGEIRSDLTSAPGLDAEEAELAVRAGLIAEAERWWWMEHWLAGEREAEREIREGRVEEFADAKSFFEDLCR